MSMGLGFTPTVVEGPAGAALREKLGERQIRVVEELASTPCYTGCAV